jgi:hypothetical protein
MLDRIVHRRIPLGRHFAGLTRESFPLVAWLPCCHGHLLSLRSRSAPGARSKPADGMHCRHAPPVYIRDAAEGAAHAIGSPLVRAGDEARGGA